MSNLDVAVIVPLHKTQLTDAENFSIINTANVLSSKDIYFVGPKKNSRWLSEFASSLSHPSLNVAVFNDEYFLSVSSYNRLMLSKSFYRRFMSYRYILIVQPDALVFTDDLSQWIDDSYSYVGAPWFEGMEKPLYPLRFLGVGNGGLSLRKTADCLRVLSSLRYIPDTYAIINDHGLVRKFKRFILQKAIYAYNIPPLLPRVNEDMFWGLLTPKRCSFFTVPVPCKAMYFSFEAEPRYLFSLTKQKLPFGCHAWEKYDKKFWEEILSGKN